MTYQSGSLGKIQASDINGFLNNNTPNLNGLWSTGSGNSGYGQTAVGGVAVTDKVKESPWKELIAKIIAMAGHQGTAYTTMVNTVPPTGPATGTKIRIIADNINTVITNNLSALNTNRLNASLSGSTSAASVATRSTSWSDTISTTFTITFSSHDNARYYFNAGGQIGIEAFHPNTTNINRLISEICSNLGTVWMSSPVSGTTSIAGSSYSGITQISTPASGSSVTINSNFGFYNWTNTDTTVVTQYGGLVYGGGGTGIAGGPYQYYQLSTFAKIAVRYNGAGVITVTYTLDEVPNGATVSSGSTATIKLKPPSITNLANSWGTPTVTNSGFSGS